MEVLVSLGIIEANQSGRYHDFDVVAFYPGKQRKDGLTEGWKESREDVSPLPVAHLLERSFKKDSIVIYKRPDFLSSRLIHAHGKGTLFSGMCWVHIKNNGQKAAQIGRYEFDFKVSKMLINQSNERGDRWERMELKIVDKTEKIMGLE